MNSRIWSMGAGSACHIRKNALGSAKMRSAHIATYVRNDWENCAPAVERVKALPTGQDSV